jgi:hypothetical protein
MIMGRFWRWLKTAFHTAVFGPPPTYEAEPAPPSTPEPKPVEIPSAQSKPADSTALVIKPRQDLVAISQPQDQPADKIPVAAPRSRTAEHRVKVFSFREAILDQLADYMVYLKRMKRTDRYSYDLYSQVGAHIISPEILRTKRDQALSPWWRQTLPSFGAVASGVSRTIEADEDQGNHLWPRFVYFRRYERPPSTVERVNTGAIYAVTVYWDKASWNHRKTGIPTEFPICILPDGSVRLLRAMVSHSQVITHRTGKYRGCQTKLEHQRWGIADFFKDWAAEHSITPQQFLCDIFIDCANIFEAANAEMIRIAATRDDITAVFSIDIRHTPAFFADREQTFTEGGRRRRIFHIARTHTRTTSAGRVIPVRTHFRGARRFNWNGYGMKISVPHLHHADPASFSVGAIDEAAVLPTDGKLVDGRWLGSMMAQHIDDGWKARA